MILDTDDTICIRPNGPGWEAITGTAEPDIVRTDMALEKLVEWLRKTYPTEKAFVFLPY